MVPGLDRLALLRHLLRTDNVAGRHGRMGPPVRGIGAMQVAGRLSVGASFTAAILIVALRETGLPPSLIASQDAIRLAERAAGLTPARQVELADLQRRTGRRLSRGQPGRPRRDPEGSADENLSPITDP